MSTPPVVHVTMQVPYVQHPDGSWHTDAETIDDQTLRDRQRMEREREWEETACCHDARREAEIRADERAKVAEEIARHFEERGDRSTGIPPFRAAQIARQHTGEDT